MMFDKKSAELEAEAFNEFFASVSYAGDVVPEPAPAEPGDDTED